MSSGVFLSNSESYLFQIVDRFLSGQTIAYGSEKLLLEGCTMNLARYEAVIRAGLKGMTKFFVME